MHKIIIALTCLATLAAPSQRAGHPRRIFPGRTGLVLIASTHDGFAVAADGAQANADGTWSETPKILPVGKYGAVAFAGAVSIQDPVEKPIRQELNVVNLTSAWLKSHPDANMSTANREINSLLSVAVDKFFSTRDFGPDAAKYKFTVILAGYADGKPLVTNTQYSLPQAKGGAVRTEAVSSEAKPGDVWVFGNARVQAELMAGTSHALKKFKGELPLRKFRSFRPGNKSAQEFVDVFDTILRASESDEGRKFAGGAPIVAPPDRFAIVTAQDGFAWSKAAVSKAQ